MLEASPSSAGSVVDPNLPYWPIDATDEGLQLGQNEYDSTPMEVRDSRQSTQGKSRDRPMPIVTHDGICAVSSQQEPGPSSGVGQSSRRGLPGCRKSSDRRTALSPGPAGMAQPGVELRMPSRLRIFGHWSGPRVLCLFAPACFLALPN